MTETKALKIERDVPLPDRRKSRRPEVIDALRALSRDYVGASVFIPTDNRRATAKLVQEIMGVGNYTTQVREENGVKGVRVWRV